MVTHRTAPVATVLGGILLIAGLLWWLFLGDGETGPEGIPTGETPKAADGDHAAGVRAPLGEAAQREKIADETPSEVPEASVAIPSPQSGALRIRVVDGTNEARVPGVGVLVREAPRQGPIPKQRRFRADTQGEVLVEGLRPGRATVATDRRNMGYRVVEVIAGTVTDVTITMKDGIAITGVVVDTKGTHVPGATVLLGGWGGGSVTAITQTDQNGRFAIRPAPGRIHVAARARDHAPSPFRLITAGAGAAVDVRIVLPGVGGNVEGRVLDPDGNGVADAVVTFGDELPRGLMITLPDGAKGMHPPQPWERTDTGGRFHVAGVKPGVSPVTVETSSFAPWSGQVDVVAHTTVPMEIRLTRGVSIDGTVKEESGGVLAGVEVRQGDYGAIDLRRTRTAQDGTYSLVGLPAGKPLTIHVQEDNYGNATRRLQGADGETLRGDIVLSRGLVLEGRVLGRGDKPVHDARVFATGPRVEGQAQWFRDASTDEAGGFQVNGCPAGPVIDLQVSARNHREELRTKIDATAGIVEVRMHYEGPATARVVGRLMDPDGVPVTNALIFVGRDGGSGGAAYSASPTGQIRIEKLKPGLLTVRIRAGTHAGFVSEERALASGETWDLGTVQLRRGGRLRVDFRRPASAEKERIYVSIYRGGLWLSGFGTRKRILLSDPLTPDDYHLELHGPKVVPLRIPFTIREGEQTDVRATPIFGTNCKFELTLPEGAEATRVVNYEIRGPDGFAYRSRRTRRPPNPVVVETGLAPGDYSIRAESVNGHVARHNFQVRSGSESETIRLDMK